MPKIPSPHEAYQQGIRNAALIPLAPAFLLALIIACDRVVMALYPWPFVVGIAWLLWRIGRYVYARWR